MLKRAIAFLLLSAPVFGAGFPHTDHGPMPSLSAGTSTYIIPGTGDGMEFTTTIESVAQVPYRDTGTITNLWASVASNSLNGGSTITIRDNGVDVATLTVSAGATGDQQTWIGTATINSGDLIDWCVKAGGTSGSIVLYGLQYIYTPTSGSMMKWVLGNAGGNANPNGFATYFDQIVGPLNWSTQTESSLPPFQIPVSGTLQNFGIRLLANTLAVPQEARIRKNSSGTALTIHVNSNQTGMLENSTTTVHVSSGDLIDFSYYMGGTGNTGVTTPSFMSIEFVPDNSLVMPIVTMNVGHGITPSSFVPFEGALGWNTPETAYHVPVSTSGTLSLFEGSINNTTAETAMFVLRVNASSSTLTFNVPASSSGYFSDQTHSRVVVSSDFLAVANQIGTDATGTSDYFVSVLTLPTPAAQTAALTSFWGSDGGDKIPQEVCYPHGVNYSSSTLSRTWDGTNILPFSAKNETAHFEVVACDVGTSTATNVTVSMSSLTCTSGGIADSVTRSSTTVQITTGVPVQVFSAKYIQNKGISYLPFNRGEFEERELPLDMRVPCVVQGGGNCLATPATDLWVNRKYHDMHVPMAWVPWEEYTISSQTVNSVQSQSYWVDIYVSSTIPAPNQCQGTFSIFEGTLLSTAIPVNLKVYNLTLSSAPGLTDNVYITPGDVKKRLQGSSSCSTPACISAVDSVAQMFKAHNLLVQGDSPDSVSNYFPSVQWTPYTNGGAFVNSKGFGNSRGVGIPNINYFIGQYGGPYWTPTGGAFEIGASSWAFYCSNNNLNCAIYTPNDEGSVTPVPAAEAQLVSTSPASQFNGYKLAYVQTDNFPDTIYGSGGSTAPYVSWPASTGQGYDDTYPSSTTWDVLASSIMAGNSLTGSLGQLWMYNDSSIGWGAMFPYDEEGYVPRANYWILAKKLCYNGRCHGGHFFWQGTGWSISGVDSDLYNDPHTFGTNPSSDTVFGRGGTYSQGSGVLLYPGTDSVFANPSFGFQGAVAAFTLKNIRQGVDDVDYWNAAYAVNPSSATSVLNSVVSAALWEVPCVNNFVGGDCTYSAGDRNWSYGTDTYVRAAERLLQIASQTSTLPVDSISGGALIQGGAKFQ